MLSKKENMKDDPIPTKFHKSLGNVKDNEIGEGEIRLLRALIRDTEFQIIQYRLKEARIAEKIKKLWDSIKKDKRLAQEARQFIDTHPLFASICTASGITPDSGRKKFYKRVNDTIERKLQRRRRTHAESEDRSEFTSTSED